MEFNHTLFSYQQRKMWHWSPLSYAACAHRCHLLHFFIQILICHSFVILMSQCLLFIFINSFALFVVFFLTACFCSARQISFIHLVCEHNDQPHNPLQPFSVSLVPYECETDCYSEGQRGISYPRVGQDLAWMALYNWLISSSVFFNLSLHLSNLCIVSLYMVSMPAVSQFDCSW